jgi:hypothetical protein
MNQTLNDTSKKTAAALIAISTKLAHKMDKWHNIVVGEGSLQSTERAGFVNKTSADTGIDLVIDVLAPKDVGEAALRTWALDSHISSEGAKVFNNIQLTFDIDYETARALTERFDTVTRDDIQTLLHQPSTSLQSVAISNQSGLSPSANIIPGQYYDVSADEITEQNITDEVCSTLATVLATLKQASEAELG